VAQCSITDQIVHPRAGTRSDARLTTPNRDLQLRSRPRPFSPAPFMHHSRPRQACGHPGRFKEMQQIDYAAIPSTARLLSGTQFPTDAPPYPQTLLGEDHGIRLTHPFRGQPCSCRRPVASSQGFSRRSARCVARGTEVRARPDRSSACQRPLTFRNGIQSAYQVPAFRLTDRRLLVWPSQSE
jgi:hypothetical protein